MVSCDMCGKKIEKGIKARIESTDMSVCENCAKYGVVLGNIGSSKSSNSNNSFQNKPYKKKVIREEVEEDIISNYGKIVKTAREKLNLKQEELAKKINERESLIHQIESEHLKPSIATAKKLEKFFGIKLIQIVNNSDDKNVNQQDDEKKQSKELTFGDLIEKAMNKSKKK
jgi:putative transcription factor